MYDHERELARTEPEAQRQYMATHYPTPDDKRREADSKRLEPRHIKCWKCGQYSKNTERCTNPECWALRKKENK